MNELPRIHTRRDLLRTGLLVAAGAGLAAACGTTSTASQGAASSSATAAAGSTASSSRAAASSGTATSAASSSTASSASAAPSASAATGFPITTAHKFGSTITRTQPARVLSLGYTDHEVLLALGIVPVGVIQWIPEWKKGVSPWSEKLLNGTTPALFGYELDFEKAASLEPDLIFNIGFDPDRKTYDTLTAIAPTVAPPKGTKAYGVGWEEMTAMVSTAVGRKTDGDRLIADTKALLTRAAGDNPSFKGKTVAIGNVYQGTIGYYTSSDIRSQLLHELGFVDNTFISGLQEDNFYGTLSPEKVDSLDADLLIFFGEPDTTRASLLKAYPSLATVPAVKEGRMLLMTDLEEVMAFSSASVLSIPIALEALLPGARKALA